MPRPTLRKRYAKIATWVALATALTACGPASDVVVVEGVIDRATFVDVYVELRSEAIQSPGLTITEEAREAVLARHGVDDESLLAFVDAYGRELEYMNDVWAEVERRIEALPAVPRDPSGSGA